MRTGGSCEMGLGMCVTPLRIGGVVCSVGTPVKRQAWQIFPSRRTSSASPPRGIVAVLVLDGKCGNGCGNVVRSAVIVRIRSEWVSARGCERASPGSF